MARVRDFVPQGVIPAVLLPFHDDFSIDEKSFRNHLRDVAFKVVGVGSVGTFCAIGLLMSDDEAPLLLQIKEAQESVLAAFAGATSGCSTATQSCSVGVGIPGSPGGGTGDSAQPVSATRPGGGAGSNKPPESQGAGLGSILVNGAQ